MRARGIDLERMLLLRREHMMRNYEHSHGLSGRKNFKIFSESIL